MNFNPPDAVARALFGVLCAANIIFLGQRIRRRFARFFPLGNAAGIVLGGEGPEFKQLTAFADHLHLLAHDYGVEIVAVAYDEKNRVYHCVSFGERRCDASDEERANDYQLGAIMLTKDSIGLRQASREAES